MENLCDHPTFTGYTVDGGYAEYAVAPENFVYAVPESFSDQHAAPLLCAGIIGFRCCAFPESNPAAVSPFTVSAPPLTLRFKSRVTGERKFTPARAVQNISSSHCDLGAVWAGEAADEPPVKLDAAIIFAPAGELVPPALKALKKGGVLVLGGIHMSPIPSFDYDLLYQETRYSQRRQQHTPGWRRFSSHRGGNSGSHPGTIFPLRDANRALNDLKSDRVNGAAVLDCRI